MLLSEATNERGRDGCLLVSPPRRGLQGSLDPMSEALQPATSQGDHMLTDNSVRSLRPCAKPRKVFDAKGLFILVTPPGGRLWRFKYRFPPRVAGNKEKQLSLGSYPEVSLAQARERRDAARQDLAQGIDPSLRRTCEKICLGNTFEAVAREFISVLRAAGISAEAQSTVAADLIRQTLRVSNRRRLRSREPISANTVDSMERRLETHVFPYLGQQDVQLISAPQLLDCVVLSPAEPTI